MEQLLGQPKEELLSSCSRISSCERLIWIFLLYLHSNFPQRCRNVTPVWISLPSAKCGQNLQASSKFNRVKTDKHHYHISLISFRIQARNMCWGFYSAIMCIKTVWNNVISRNGTFRIICSAYESTTTESCCVHVYKHVTNFKRLEQPKCLHGEKAKYMYKTYLWSWKNIWLSWF